VLDDGGQRRGVELPWLPSMKEKWSNECATPWRTSEWKWGARGLPTMVNLSARCQVALFTDLGKTQNPAGRLGGEGRRCLHAPSCDLGRSREAV
jgi:hypothetical protein